MMNPLSCWISFIIILLSCLTRIHSYYLIPYQLRSFSTDMDEDIARNINRQLLEYYNEEAPNFSDNIKRSFNFVPSRGKKLQERFNFQGSRG
uniref:Neuropeptide-Like Protein n=1 Tax=Strongyloides venezuelensis TaxID=75913 RepID=A0A0K0FNA1_STRVS